MESKSEEIFDIEQRIKNNLSLKSYIFLINEYIELEEKVKVSQYKYEELEQMKITIKVLNSHSIKIPEELNYIWTKLCDELSFIDRCSKLSKDICDIVPICNLRYLIGDIADKEKLSFESISINIGCAPNTLDDLVYKTYGIKESDIKKFIDYYGIKQIIDCWKGRYVHN